MRHVWSRVVSSHAIALVVAMAAAQIWPLAKATGVDRDRVARLTRVAAQRLEDGGRAAHEVIGAPASEPERGTPPLGDGEATARVRVVPTTAWSPAMPPTVRQALAGSSARSVRGRAPPSA